MKREILRETSTTTTTTIPSILHDLISGFSATASSVLNDNKSLSGYNNFASSLLNDISNGKSIGDQFRETINNNNNNNSGDTKAIANATAIILLTRRSLQDNSIIDDIQTTTTTTTTFIENDNNSSSIPSSSSNLDDINIALTIVYLIIFLIGVIGNVCNCLVIADGRNRDMKTPTNYYLFSLSVSDLLLLIFGLPHDLINLWHPNGYMFSQFVCISRGWISEASTNASVLVIVAFSMERYLAICHPLKAHKWSHLSRSIKIICLIWLVASTCAFVVVWQYGLVLIDDKQVDGTLLGSVWQCTMVSQGRSIFELSVFIFFILPMTIITIVYLKLGYHLRKKSKLHSSRIGSTSQKANNNISPHQTTTTTNNNNNNNNNINHRCRAIQRPRFSSFRHLATHQQQQQLHRQALQNNKTSFSNNRLNLDSNCASNDSNNRFSTRKTSEHLIVASAILNSAGQQTSDLKIGLHHQQQQSTTPLLSIESKTNESKSETNIAQSCCCCCDNFSEPQKAITRRSDCLRPNENLDDPITIDSCHQESTLNKTKQQHQSSSMKTTTNECPTHPHQQQQHCVRVKSLGTQKSQLTKNKRSLWNRLRLFNSNLSLGILNRHKAIDNRGQLQNQDDQAMSSLMERMHNEQVVTNPSQFNACLLEEKSNSIQVILTKVQESDPQSDDNLANQLNANDNQHCSSSCQTLEIIDYPINSNQNDDKFTNGVSNRKKEANNHKQSYNSSPVHSSAGSIGAGQAISKISFNSNVNTSNLNSVFKMLGKFFMQKKKHKQLAKLGIYWRMQY